MIQRHSFLPISSGSRCSSCKDEWSWSRTYGGTIDKLESVKGFNVEISEKDFIKLVNDNQVAVIGQSGNLTPADKNYMH